MAAPVRVLKGTRAHPHAGTTVLRGQTENLEAGREE